MQNFPAFIATAVSQHKLGMKTAGLVNHINLPQTADNLR